MSPECNTVMYLPLLTLKPNWIKSTMLSVIALDDKTSKQVNNPLCPYVVVIGKQSLEAEYETIMSKNALKRQKNYADSLLKHFEETKETILVRKDNYNAKLFSVHKPKFITEILTDDEVILLYITTMGLWRLVVTNQPLQFDVNLVYLDGRYNEEKKLNFPDQQTSHLPIDTHILLPPVLTPENNKVFLLRENNEIISHLLISERMAVTLDHSINILSDKEFAAFLYRANTCDSKLSAKNNLNKLGILLRARLTNIIYKYQLKLDKYLKIPTAGHLEDSSIDPGIEDDGLALAYMIVAFIFTPMTAANVNPPSKVDSPGWKKDKTTKVVINKPIKGRFGDVFLNHSCCGDVVMAGYFLMLLDLVKDNQRNKSKICSFCTQQDCFKQLISATCSPILMNVAEKLKNEYLNVGLLFLTETNIAGTFAGTIRESVDKNATKMDFLKSLLHDNIQEAYKISCQANDLENTMNTITDFKSLIQTLCKNLANLESYLNENKHGIKLPVYNDIHGDKLEAQWGRTVRPELQYIGICYTMIDKSSQIRWLNAAVSRFNETVDGEDIFPMLINTDSTKFYTTHVTPLTNMGTQIDTSINHYSFTPIVSDATKDTMDVSVNLLDRMNKTDDEKPSSSQDTNEIAKNKNGNWITIANPKLKETDLIICREKLANVSEKTKYLMCILPGKDNIDIYKIDSKFKKDKTSEETTVMKHKDVLVNKLFALLQNLAKKYDIKIPSLKNFRIIKIMLAEILNKSILTHLTIMNEAIDISNTERLKRALIMTTIMAQGGFKPSFNEQRKSKIVHWVHYNKPHGNILDDSLNCHVVYEDIGFIDDRMVYTKDLVMYGRFAISSYPASQGNTICYSFTMNNYDFIADNAWFTIASKNERHMPCKYIPGAIFAIALSKPIKFEKDNDIIKKKNKFVNSIRDEHTFVGRISKMHIQSPDFNLKEFGRYMLGIEDTLSETEIKNRVNQMFDQNFNAIVTNLEMTDIMNENIMVTTLKNVIKGITPNQKEYKDVLAIAKELDSSDTDDEEDYSFGNLFKENPFHASNKTMFDQETDDEISQKNDDDLSTNSDIDESIDTDDSSDYEIKRKRKVDNESENGKKIKIQSIM